MAGADRASSGAEASVGVASLAVHARHREAWWPEQQAGDEEKTAMSVFGS